MDSYVYILFMFGHCNHLSHIVIHDIDALDLVENFFIPPFSLYSKFICEICQTWILITIYIIFAIRHYNHVLYIGIHDIDALDLQEKLFFPLFTL